MTLIALHAHLMHARRRPSSRLRPMLQPLSVVCMQRQCRRHTAGSLYGLWQPAMQRGSSRRAVLPTTHARCQPQLCTLTLPLRLRCRRTKTCRHVRQHSPAHDKPLAARLVDRAAAAHQPVPALLATHACVPPMQMALHRLWPAQHRQPRDAPHAAPRGSAVVDLLLSRRRRWRGAVVEYDMHPRLKLQERHSQPAYL